MCMKCSVSLDEGKRDAFSERLLGMLNGGMTMLMVSLGHRSGLFDAMNDGAGRSVASLAAETGLDERYVREWLGAMVAAGIVERDPARGAHRLPPEHGHWLSRAEPTNNLGTFAQYLSVLGRVEDEVLACFREGGGVPYEKYPRFHDVMAEDSGQSIVPVIVELAVPLVPGLHERLTAGIDVLDIGCGRGRALLRLVEAYDKSRFVGYDLSAEAVAEGNRAARAAGLGNLNFEVRDLTTWREPGAFDWITALDAIHDQARPDKVLRAIREALRPGGLGLGAAWGVQLAESMLREAGFDSVRVHRFEHDVQNAYFVMET